MISISSTPVVNSTGVVVFRDLIMIKKLTFISADVPNSDGEYLSAIKIQKAVPFNNGRHQGLMVEYDDQVNPDEPDSDCALIYPVIIVGKNDVQSSQLYAYYDGSVYRIDQYFINRSTIQLLEQLSECNPELLEQLSKPDMYRPW